MKSFLLTSAIALGLASNAASAAVPATLPTVEVRPSAEQIAERNAARVVSLPAVQVRPSAEQVAWHQAQQQVVTLATVQVRPSLAQRAQREAVVTLATVQVRPSAAQVAALRLATAEASPRASAAQWAQRMLEAALVKLPTADLELTTGGLQRLIDGLGQTALDRP